MTKIELEIQDETAISRYESQYMVFSISEFRATMHKFPIEQEPDRWYVSGSIIKDSRFQDIKTACPFDGTERECDEFMAKIIDADNKRVQRKVEGLIDEKGDISHDTFVHRLKMIVGLI